MAPRQQTSRETRFDLELPATLSFDGQDVACTVVNLSMSGAFVRVEPAPSLQTILALGIQPPMGPPLLFHARVVRAGLTLDSRLNDIAGCGLEFLNLTPESEGRLAYLLKQVSWKPR